MSRPLPTPSLVVLVGPPASGKSTWAKENFAAEQILSTDTLRGVVGEHDLDLAATEDAFEILDRILAMRLARGLTTVVDTTALDPGRRESYLERANNFGVSTVVVRFTTSAAECRRRNRARSHSVPTKALDAMLKLAREVDLEGEGWDQVIEPEPVRTVTARLQEAVAPAGDDSDTRSQSSTLAFGLLVSRYYWPGGAGSIGPTLAQIAVSAEEAGFDSIWVMDHMIQIPQVGAAWEPMLDSYTTLGFLAGKTSKIRLGVLVSAVTFRNIGHLAKMIATLDVLSGGRAIAGLGAGNSKREHDAYGWGFASDSDRLACLEDALQALPLLWGPGSPSYEGKTLSIPEALSYPRPLQDPMPIIVGGSGERVTLRLAAEYASGCNLFGNVDAVRNRIDILHRHCRDVGRDPADLEVTHLSEVLVGSDSSDLHERIDRLRPANTGPDRYAEQVNAGTVEDHEAGFKSLASAGVHTAIVSTPDLDGPSAFAPLAQLIERFVS